MTLHALDRTREAPSRLLPGWWWRGGEGVGYGRALGLGSLVLSGIAFVLLRPAEVHWLELVGLAAFHLAAFWASFSLPWQRWSGWALLAFPVVSMAGLVLVSHAAPALTGALVGFFVLCFAYVGLFLPPHGGWVLLPVALLTYFGTVGEVTAELGVRTLFVAAAWIALSELLNRMQRRQLALIRRLRDDNRTDPLTGLANRRGMELFLAEAEPGDVLIVFDLDHFKRLNDERGHAHGDAVLRTFGSLLLQQLRTRDRAARSGGEEFVVLVRAGRTRRGQTVTQRFRTELGAACPGVTFSAGIAVVRADRTVHETLEEADRAMYAAKNAGRDQVWLAGDDGGPGVCVIRNAAFTLDATPVDA